MGGWVVWKRLKTPLRNIKMAPNNCLDLTLVTSNCIQKIPASARHNEFLESQLISVLPFFFLLFQDKKSDETKINWLFNYYLTF